MKTVVQLFP